MSSEQYLCYRALAARYLVKQAVKEAGKRDLFRPHIPFLGDPGSGIKTPARDIPDIPFPDDPGSDIKPPTRGIPEKLPVCIIGAGVAGLRIAMCLPKGIKYDLLEASDRHGGRVRTHHFTTTENDYFDVGAMRFPKISALKLTFQLFEELKLKKDNKVIEYIMSTSNNFRLFNGQKRTSAQASEEGDPFKDFPYVPPEYLKASFKKRNGETVKGAEAIVAKALEPFKVALVEDFTKGWELLMGFDDLSVREYFFRFMKRETPPGETDDGKLGLPFFVIQWMERTDTSTGSYDLAFSEAVLESIQFDYPFGSGSPEEPKKQLWACVQGGSSVITDRMCESLSTKPLYNHRATAIKMESVVGTRQILPRMFIKVQNHPEFDNKAYSHIYVTTSLSCLSLMDLTQAGLSYVQNQAIRSLGYGASVKIGIKFRTRWWQQIQDFPQVGGVSYTDRPVRVVVYPSYGIKEPKAPGTLIASYTWTQDASRLGAFSAGHGSTAEQHLLNIIYNDFAAVHGNTPDWYRSETVSYYVHDWYHDEFSVGAYAQFRAGQYRHYYADMSMPAALGSLHFAGEAISTQHAWIEGALASATRCVYQTMITEWPDLLEDFKRDWPMPEEVDLDPADNPGDIEPGLDRVIDYERLQVVRGIELSREALLTELKC